MAVVVISDSSSDIEVAVRLNEVFASEPTTSFRRQILDVVQSNVEGLFAYEEVGDDD